MSTTYDANTGYRRVRTPHAHDVLSGRGGGINMHEGNAQFREWVRVRKNDYNLAVNKTEKTRVAREVIDLVVSQDPPGRFLQREPGSGLNGWWIELDEERVMAKTSQALREGAPQIREANKDVIAERRAQNKRQRRNANTRLPEQDVARQLAVDELKANADAARLQLSKAAYDRPTKRVRVDYRGQMVHPNDATPTLTSAESPEDIPEPMSLPLIPTPRGLPRSHSLAFSDVSNIDGDWDQEFVNPFENEEEAFALKNLLSSPLLTRETSMSSDHMGGLNTLFRSDSSRSSVRASLSNNKFDPNAPVWNDPWMETPLNRIFDENEPTPVSP